MPSWFEFRRHGAAGRRAGEVSDALPPISPLRAPTPRRPSGLPDGLGASFRRGRPPTASLHFDEDLLARLTDRGVRFAHVTLHVGAGTFLPVRSRT